MRKIADTPFGRNALAAGLISHMAALLAGTIPASGGDPFFTIVYPFSCLCLLTGAFRELTNGGCRPLAGGRFYLIAAVSLFPLFGPLLVMGFLYQGLQGQGSLAGFIPAILKLRANALMVFSLMILLMLLFAFFAGRNDPYFRKHRQGMNPPQHHLFSSVLGERSSSGRP
jgi:hypothetical protein